MRPETRDLSTKVLVILATLLLFSGGCSKAQESAPTQRKGFKALSEEPVNAELIAEHVSIQPGGSTRVGVKCRLENGWHIYAEEPGDAGLPTKIAWSGPSGVVFGPLPWPPAQQFVDPGDIRTFGYTGTVVLSSAMTLEPTAAPANPLSLRAHVEWLACKEICVPGSADLKLNLPVSAAAPIPSPHARLFSSEE